MAIAIRRPRRRIRSSGFEAAGPGDGAAAASYAMPAATDHFGPGPERGPIGNAGREKTLAPGRAVR